MHARVSSKNKKKLVYNVTVKLDKFGVVDEAECEYGVLCHIGGSHYHVTTGGSSGALRWSLASVEWSLGMAAAGLAALAVYQTCRCRRLD